MRWPLLFVVVLSSLSLGCGGSGSDSSVSENDELSFGLFQPGVFSAGFSESYDITGSDAQGQTYSGRFSYQTQPETTFNGEVAIPVVQTLEFTNVQTGATSIGVGTEFYSVDANSVRLVGLTTDTVTITSATPVAVPLTAKVGQSGAVGTYLDNAGNTRVGSWRLERGEGSTARYVTLVSTTDQSGNVIETSEFASVVDTSGNRQSAEVRINNVSLGVSLVLSGVKN